jgi:hypothetical protein
LTRCWGWHKPHKSKRRVMLDTSPGQHSLNPTKESKMSTIQNHNQKQNIVQMGGACQSCMDGNCCGNCWCCYHRFPHVARQPYFIPRFIIPATAFTAPPEPDPLCQLCRCNPAPIIEDGIYYCPGCFEAYGKPWPGEEE